MGDSVSHSGGIPWRSRKLYLVLGIAMVAPLDVTIVGPALPAIAEAFDIPSSRTGLVITAFATPGIVLAPVVGMLADRLGRKRVVTFCLFVYGLAGVLVLVASEYWTVLLLRAVQGSVGGSVLASLALTLVGDFYEGPTRNAVMGLTSAAISVSAALGPAMGGALATLSWDAPFALYGLSVVVGVAVVGFLDDPAIGGTDEAIDFSYIRDAAASLPARDAVLFYGANLVGFVLFFGGVLTAVPFLLDETYGLGSGRIGSLVTAAMMVSAVVAILNGRFARRLTNLSLVALGFVGYGLGFVGAGVATSTPQLFASLVVFGAGHGLVLPSVASGLSELAPAEFRGGVMSLRTSCVLASQSAGPPLFTVPAGVVGYEPTLLVGGVVGLCVALVLGVARRAMHVRA